MSDIGSWMVDFSGFLRPHLDKVAMSIVATTIFLYGFELHGVIKKQIDGCPLLLRVLILILVCAFGYGTLTVGCSMLFQHLLGFLDKHYLAPVVLSLFLLLGILAERKKGG